MISGPWENMFPLRIWQRGVDYYADGRVLSIQYGDDRVTAEVVGNEIYTVSVTLNRERSGIIDYFCDCPYGENGTPCKHLAALLCALQDDQWNPIPEKENGHRMEDLVGRLPESQVRSILIRLAKANPRVRKAIQLTAAMETSQSGQKSWEDDLKELTDYMADRNGFINYENATEYCHLLVEYMNDRLSDLLLAGRTMEAFQLTWLTFQIGTEQHMDDSDGGLSTLAAVCMDAWSEILKQADLEEQREMLHWFTVYYNSLVLGKMYLDGYLYDAPWKDEMGPQLLLLLDQQIHECARDESNQYRLEDLVFYRAKWMERTGKSGEEREQFLAQYHYLPRIREMRISQAMQKGDWAAALALLEESKNRNKDKAGLVAKYSKQIIEICEKTGNRELLLVELRDYLFHFWQYDLVYVSKFKALLSPSQWAEELGRLLKSETMYFQVYPLLEQERMYEELMQRLEKSTDISGLEKYEGLLGKSYEQRCRDVYVSYLQSAMDQAGNRKAYWSVIQILKKVRNYPDGKAVAQTLADCWRAKFPRRTSMLDELEKAGF